MLLIIWIIFLGTNQFSSRIFSRLSGKFSLVRVLYLRQSVSINKIDSTNGRLWFPHKKFCRGLWGQKITYLPHFFFFLFISYHFHKIKRSFTYLFFFTNLQRNKRNKHSVQKGSLNSSLSFFFLNIVMCLRSFMIIKSCNLISQNESI